MSNYKRHSLKARLSTHTLAQAAWGNDVVDILASALSAVEPGKAVKRQFRHSRDTITIARQSFNLNDLQRIFVIGAGKAGIPMANAIAHLLEERLTSGIMIVKEGSVEQSPSLEKITIIEAGHPLPDKRGVKGTDLIFRLLRETQANDLVICLISGGGSALMVSPVPGVSLVDLQEMTSMLLACGADIVEINTLRKHLDQVKGGGLARLTAPAKLVTLILSDVVGDPLDVIASGPTVPDQSTFQDAWEVLHRYNLLDRIPISIHEHIQRGLHGEVPETPKPGDTFFAHCQNVIIGSNQLAAKEALDVAQSKGFNSMLLTTYLQGEARHAGRFLGAIAQEVSRTGQPVPRPACIIAGGETTVTLQGDGLGGRNLEVALSAVRDMESLPSVALITFATDGDDGPTDAAGAVVTGETLYRAQEIGFNPDHFLAHNDSYHFFEPLGDLIKPGPTHTNVNDLNILFAF